MGYLPYVGACIYRILLAYRELAELKLNRGQDWWCRIQRRFSRLQADQWVRV